MVAWMKGTGKVIVNGIISFFSFLTFAVLNTVGVVSARVDNRKARKRSPMPFTCRSLRILGIKWADLVTNTEMLTWAKTGPRS